MVHPEENIVPRSVLRGSFLVAPTLLAFSTILHFRVSYGLPLHVARVVFTPGAQRLDVVHNVAGARSALLPSRWTGVLLHKCGALMRVALGLTIRRKGHTSQRH